jgi:tRNA A37 threonylcarbamoyladenosine dehydratase
MKYDRCRKLFSNFEKLQQLKVLICGIGGVGGYALDCLYKSGITNITAIDFDIFEIHNQNRQIGSEHIGEKKVEVFKKLYPKIEIIDTKITPQWVDKFEFDKFDFVIDAIDDIPAKIALIKKTYPKIISSMGAAKRVDPTKIEISNIWKTYNDPFAKIIRDRLKKDKFTKNFRVVFSNETPIRCEKGSFVGVTATFGMALCSEIVKKR